MDSIHEKLIVLQNKISSLDEVLLALVLNYDYVTLHKTLIQEIDKIGKISEERMKIKVVELSSLQVFLDDFQEHQQETLSGIDTLKDQLLSDEVPKREGGQQLTYSIMLSSFMAKKINVWQQIIEIIVVLNEMNQALIDEIKDLKKVSQEKLEKFDGVITRDDSPEESKGENKGYDVIKTSKGQGLFNPPSVLKDEDFVKQSKIMDDMIELVGHTGFNRYIEDVQQAREVISQLSSNEGSDDLGHLENKGPDLRLGGILTKNIDSLIERMESIGLLKVDSGRDIENKLNY
ncbi:MAG TPA: hypothetical protein QF353_01600 [Gammaproteobacteria bacterium]|nr:hypothetical protein [Gammaproteobacteria bacterium]